MLGQRAMPEVNKCILIGDDDTRTKVLLRNALHNQGFKTQDIQTIGSLNRQIARCRADLVLLNVDYNGSSLSNAHEIFKPRISTPIVTISDTFDKDLWISMLEAGADDHVFKPFEATELVARIRSVLRRYGHSSLDAPGNAGHIIHPKNDPPCKNQIRFDRWIVNPERYEVKSLAGEPCVLTSGDFNLLMVFMKNAHQVLSRDDIMDALHGHEWSPFDRSIDNQISRLRKKIEPDPSAPRIIKTIRGVGYAFVADIQKL